MEDVNKSLDEVIEVIQSTKEYQRCISLKEKMSHNEEIQSLVKEVKDYQKKYVRSNYDSSIKEKLDDLEKRLEEIPVYVVYLQSLEEVNHMIDYVRDSLNDYFDHLFQ